MDGIPFLVQWFGGKREASASDPGGLLMVVLDVQAEMRLAGHDYAGIYFRGLDGLRRLYAAGNFMARATGDELDEAASAWWAQAVRVRGEQLDARLAKVLRGDYPARPGSF